MSDWQVCPYCPPDDALWPPEAFKAAGGPWPDGKRPCNSCFETLYPKRRVNCTDCDARMETRGKAKEPRCLPCRRAARAQRGAERAQRAADRARFVAEKAERKRREEAKATMRAARPKKRKQAAPVRISFEGFRFSRRYEEAA